MDIFQFQQYVPSDVSRRLASFILDSFVGNTVFGEVELPLRGTFYISIEFPSGAVNNIIVSIVPIRYLSQLLNTSTRTYNISGVAGLVRIYIREDLEQDEMVGEIAQQISGQLIIGNPTGDVFDDHGDGYDEDQDDSGSSDGEEDLITNSLRMAEEN